ncbi:MAG: tRNA(Ile)(2)-agmatinylcytidine synthase [Thermoplasmata archaeon]|jgi:tRNA(Ile2)-agmatinylcytidine synthase
MWIGIDDTDSPRGGCTTHALTEVVRVARELGIDPIGDPRLVRLNPNIPWKTRGNAALSARFGIGRGPRRRCGSIGGRPVWAFDRGARLARVQQAELVEAAWAAVLDASRLGDAGTDPALVASARRLPSSLYWTAVRSVVRPEDVRSTLEGLGATVRIHGSDRGVVGAAASAAWPEAHPTWELLAYRDPARADRRREVDPASVRRAQERYPDLFLCTDPATRRLLVSPHTPCPILFGLRSRRRESPLRALASIRSEPVERWMLFCTNQATGDHLTVRRAASLAPYESGRIEGTVGRDPTTLRGGHVHFQITDPGGTDLDCMAFEPTKTLPAVARSLRPGDRVRVWGGRSADPTLRVEGIEILERGPRSTRARPLYCADCRRRARSLGTGRGYRCPRCHARWPPEAARREAIAPEFPVGVYHPTPSARRHLAPLGPEPGIGPRPPNT